jgi:CDP-2,3-bis-(O-geranylgeranyl)-sn-glycerol synthase
VVVRGYGADERGRQPRVAQEVEERVRAERPEVGGVSPWERDGRPDKEETRGNADGDAVVASLERGHDLTGTAWTELTPRVAAAGHRLKTSRLVEHGVLSAVALTVATGVWAILPAYVPNSVAVLVGGGPPIDGGRTWRGARLLGDGKTWRGFVGGTLGGTLVALAMNAVRPGLAPALPAFPTAAVLSLPLGAMLGDAAGSFLKRRLGRERGAPAPVLDQLGFVAVALGGTLAVAPAWTLATFTLPVLAVVLLLTPLAHLLTNVGAYLLGLKDEPW